MEETRIRKGTIFEKHSFFAPSPWSVLLFSPLKPIGQVVLEHLTKFYFSFVVSAAFKLKRPTSMQRASAGCLKRSLRMNRWYNVSVVVVGVVLVVTRMWFAVLNCSWRSMRMILPFPQKELSSQDDGRVTIQALFMVQWRSIGWVRIIKGIAFCFPYSFLSP